MIGMILFYIMISNMNFLNGISILTSYVFLLLS